MNRTRDAVKNMHTTREVVKNIKTTHDVVSDVIAKLEKALIINRGIRYPLNF